MSTIQTLQLTDQSWESLTAGVTSLLSPYNELLDGNRLVVLPDTHYPFHPSTGLVTDPDFVEAVVNRLLTLNDVEVDLGFISGPLGGAKTAEILGYGDLVDSYEIDPIFLEETASARRTVTIGSESISIDIPKPLADALIVNLPPLRTCSVSGLRSGLLNLASAIAGSDASTDTIWAAHCAFDSVTLLDAAVAYTGTPHWTGFLAASDDVADIDTAVIDAHGLADDVSYVNDRILREWRKERHIDGPTFNELAEIIEGVDLSTKSKNEGTMAAGYRLYSRVTGDGVPPVFIGGDHE